MFRNTDPKRPLQYPTPNPLERHYTVLEVAALLSLSGRTIRRIFEDEPGIVHWGSAISRRKRRYQTLRIPETVLRRVYQRLQTTR
ncbi:MAG: hypothetical protein ABSF53_07635 [Terracidiphilus sp.]